MKKEDGLNAGFASITHEATAWALAALVLDAGARHVRLVESTNSKADLETSLGYAKWDLTAWRALNKVEFENTRNLGKGSQYARLKVPSGGLVFSAFDLNHSYEETDVLVSLCKLKNHITAGVTLSMKNMFGITPNAWYSEQAGNENATSGRNVLHGPDSPEAVESFKKLTIPGMKEKFTAVERNPGRRIPQIIVDICGARPVDLAIIDGITAMEGGEGPWCEPALRPRLIKPGVLIAGLNPVSTDAVGTAVMGCANPRAERGTEFFKHCDNHLRLAEQVGLGLANLQQIEVLGQAIEKSVCQYRMTL